MVVVRLPGRRHRMLHYLRMGTGVRGADQTTGRAAVRGDGAIPRRGRGFTSPVSPVGRQADRKRVHSQLQACREPLQTGSTDREAAASRKAREEEAARAKAKLPRSNAELLLERNFQLAVADGTRLGLIDAYGETARDTLVVDLTDEAMVSSGLEYQLGRLFKGYLDNTGRSRASILELRHAGRRVGEYTWNGLARTDWR